MEGWCTDLVLTCTASWPGIGCEPREGRCVCKQEALHDCTDRRRGSTKRPLAEKVAWVARHVRMVSPPRALRLRGVGGERSSTPKVKPPYRVGLRQAGQGPLTLRWFLAHGWQGARVECVVKGQRRQFTLYHPTGAVLRLLPDVVKE